MREKVRLAGLPATAELPEQTSAIRHDCHPAVMLSLVGEQSNGSDAGFPAVPAAHWGLYPFKSRRVPLAFSLMS